MLYKHQLEALDKLHTGSILCGGVGSGKSRTSLAYFFKVNGGTLTDTGDIASPMINPTDLYIITTARKRDTYEWYGDMLPFGMYPDENSIYHNKIIVDSWNNIEKYIDVSNAFFIFDEQRVVGKGAWVKAFLKITRYGNNEWILLSATPGDSWSDYVPVFIANGFYKNRTEFNTRHVIFNPYITKYPKIDYYIHEDELYRHRGDILVLMKYEKPTQLHHSYINCSYDKQQYKDILKKRWNPFTNEPIVNISELCQCLRRSINTDWSRLAAAKDIVREYGKVIIFYNFDYELELLRSEKWIYSSENITGFGDEYECKVAEWNGHKHEPIPDYPYWVYLVQYNAGAEGWNCIETDTMIFYSENYSYKIMVQSAGRIDRLNTPFTDLYFYHLTSKASIDIAIDKALSEKKVFNEKDFGK